MQTRTEDLIKIQTQEGKQIVNARELHQFLTIQSKFADWILRRIEEYGFAENEDFKVFLKNEKNLESGRPSKEYAISLDMAKELCMVERNEKGRMARKYFIEIERRYNKLLNKPTRLAPELAKADEIPNYEPKHVFSAEFVNINGNITGRVKINKNYYYILTDIQKAAGKRF